MNEITRREAMVVFGKALDRMRADGHYPSEQTVEVLKMFFLSGCQWGLRHEFLERGSQLIQMPEGH